MTDVAFECPREIPVVVQGHLHALIIEKVVNAVTLQVEDEASEQVPHVRACVRMVVPVGECWHVSHKDVSDRARDVVRVELRLAPFSSYGVQSASQSE